MRHNKPDIQGEIDDIERLSQDLSRYEKINISVEEIIDSFDNTKEETLSDDIWGKLENSESINISKGDMESVISLADHYNKTSPKKLVGSLKNGDYNRPLILNLNNRYLLIAGNTRLCVAAALGINPKVFMGKIKMKNEKITKESTDASSSGSFEMSVSTPIKRKINKLNNTEPLKHQEIDEVTDSSSSGSYDVPFGGKRKNPLKIDGEKSIKNSRAIKDPNFPKWGGPGGIFIKIKDKCKKFPYCNQGDINAIEILRESVDEIHKKYGIPKQKINDVIIKEIRDIFIVNENRRTK